MQMRFLCVLAALWSVCLCYGATYTDAQSGRYVSSFKADVDDDGKDDLLVYELSPQQEHFNGHLQITNAAGKTLWDHTWTMTKKDLVEDLLREEGNITLEDWVKRFFDGSLAYGAIYKKTKLKETDIRPEFIEFYGQGEPLSATEISANILEQTANATLTYRASWREDVTSIVYVPKLQKFVRYTGFGN